jgi:molybdopterin-guanine dinucleotide biosynthesis protein A
MGRDKATLPVDGTAMALRVAAALVAGGCAHVVAIGGDAAALGALGLEVVADQHPGEGPLGGIITALDASDAGSVVVASCDLPWLSAATVAALIEGRGGHAVAIARGERREPLCAVWRSGIRRDLADLFEGGVRAVHRAVDALDAVEVAVDPDSVRNVNAPSDLRDATRGHDG